MRDGYRNILLVQLGDIGDVVLTTPTIRAVKEVYPDARVSVLVRKPFGDILLADPNLFEVVESEKTRGTLFHNLREYLRLVNRLQQAHYDLVIDLRAGDRGAILSFCTGARERIGRYCGDKRFWHNFLFTTTVREPQAAPLPVHPGADQSLRIVRFIGIDTEDTMPRLYINPTDQARATELLSGYGLTPANRWATINPFSRWQYKEWDHGNWSQVIDSLWSKHKLPSVLIGSKEETSAAESIIKGCEGYSFNLAGKTTLGELVAIISMSTLNLGVDSAAPHIAGAVGTPSLTIHGPSDWQAWRVADTLQKVISANIECVPCNSKGCNNTGTSQCLIQLKTEAVVEMAEDILRKIIKQEVSGHHKLIPD